jgi:hypothetical protein
MNLPQSAQRSKNGATARFVVQDPLQAASSDRHLDIFE